ncbi:MAG: adenylate/guanylate cyclase domain-containing protein, partial [Acidiferrobacterales bacterium]
RVLGLAAALARLAGAEVPEATILPLAYRGAPDGDTSPFPIYPAHSVPLLPVAWFNGKIILIGADLSLQDRHRTPLSATRSGGAGSLPGALIHAHALAQLLEGRAPRQLAFWQQALVILLLASAGLLLTLLNLPAGGRAAVGVVFIVAGWIAGFLLYQHGGPLIPLVMPTIAFGATAGVASAHMWRRERMQRRFIRQAFSKYLAPSVVAQLEAEPDRLTLGGEKRETSFLFTDIAGFTTLTEGTEPRVLVPLLNTYFDGACEIVLRHGGTLDKLVGDALHVMFNAPTDQPDHAERAVKCAMELDEFCQSFRENCASDGITFGETRIGVNTGLTVVGNFGGKDHFDYTAHGDTINTASRLESVNKYLGTRICVSGTTVQQCASIRFRPVGRLVLKGKTEAIDAFEPLSEAEAASPKMADYLEAYRSLENRDARAAQKFTELANKYADDGLIAFHAGRLAKCETGSTIVLTAK